MKILKILFHGNWKHLVGLKWTQSSLQNLLQIGRMLNFQLAHRKVQWIPHLPALDKKIRCDFQGKCNQLLLLQLFMIVDVVASWFKEGGEYATIHPCPHRMMLGSALKIPVLTSTKIFAEIWVYASSSTRAGRLLMCWTSCTCRSTACDQYPWSCGLNIQPLLLNIQKPQANALFRNEQTVAQRSRMEVDRIPLNHPD